jgi:hypothetical protein
MRKGEREKGRKDLDTETRGRGGKRGEGKEK